MLTAGPDPTQRLVETAREGDREAFAALVKAFRERLRSSIQSWTRFQLGLKVDPDDVLQDTFLRAYRTLSRFEWRGEDSFLRWLCTIAKHSLMQFAREAQRASREAAVRDAAASGASPSRILRRHERLERLEAALGKLSADHREAVLLYRLEGLTSTEVAERMNRSPAAIRQLLVRALRELKRHFGDTESLHLPDRRIRLEERDDRHEREQ